jgi:ribonucleoside-diphosphate reductase alpha chain
MAGQAVAPRTAPAAERVNPAVGRHVWETRYRYVLDGEVRERSPEESWQRVARAVARAEGAERPLWEERFHGALSRLELLPGGRILAGAGTAHRVTLFNCFVMGPIEDSLDGIFAALKEGALTMQAGGGVGYDFSTLRPRGLPARRAGAIASGPVSFMAIWNAVCATLLSTGARRGAMMATLRCDHPDIEEFIDAKRRPGALRYFNLSVQVTEAFLGAVRRDEDWPLVFPTPAAAEEPAAEAVVRRWPGRTAPILCRTLRTVRARELWDRMVRSACETGEPGALFVDRINRWNNLWYRERISATNPCGEIPLPPYGACDLASLNLTRFVEAPFTPGARLDSGRLAASVAPSWAAWAASRGPGAGPPPAFRTVADLAPADHLEMQAALQPYVDGAISKTVNLPPDFPPESLRDLFERADAMGLKGLTAFRPGPVRGDVLSAAAEEPP